MCYIYTKQILPVKIKACIFDLDGVLVDTAAFHFLAWKEMADNLNIPFNEENNEQLKGISRIDSLQKLLEMGNKELSEESKLKWLVRKNESYLRFLQRMNPDDLLPGVLTFLDQLKNNNIKMALGSASKNALRVLDLLEIRDYFDAIVDGNGVRNSKPDPEVFISGASLLGLTPESCVVFEDSIKGIEAAVRGGFKVVGIGDPFTLRDADYVIPGFEHFSIKDLNRLYE